MSGRKRDIELQRYFDGELGPGQTRKVHQRIQASAEDRLRLESLGQLHELLNENSAAAADEASFDQLWTRVQAGINEQAPLGAGERLTYWLRRYFPVVATAAAAAVLAIILLSLPSLDKPARNDAQIESLETGAEAMSTIFTIPGSKELGNTTVIWVSETSAEGDL